MRYVHPDEMTQEERERLTREAKVSVARLRLRYYEENPKVKRGAAYDEAVRIVGAFS
jgi:hypothetical protein